MLDTSEMIKKSLTGALLIGLGVLGLVYAGWSSLSLYVLRSLLPNSEWDAVAILSRLALCWAASIAVVWLGIKLVRHSSAERIE